MDYTALEEAGKSIEAKLNEREKEIFLLEQNDVSNTDAIAALGDMYAQLVKEVAELRKERMK